MNPPQIECMAMMNAIENFVSEFNRTNLYSNFGPQLGQTLLDEFGASICNVATGNDPLNGFYHFIIKVKFMPGNVYDQVNTVFSEYYQGALNF